MSKINQLICPVSTDRVDENRVRATAFGVVITMGAFLITGNPIFPILLAGNLPIACFEDGFPIHIKPGPHIDQSLLHNYRDAAI